MSIPNAGARCLQAWQRDFKQRNRALDEVSPVLLPLADATIIRRRSGVDAVALGLQRARSQRCDNDQLNAFRRRIPAYPTIDAKYTRTFGNLDLSVSGTNLGNRGYFSYGITGTGGASDVYRERRRALFVSVAARF